MMINKYHFHKYSIKLLIKVSLKKDVIIIMLMTLLTVVTLINAKIVKMVKIFIKNQFALLKDFRFIN